MQSKETVVELRWLPASLAVTCHWGEQYAEKHRFGCIFCRLKTGFHVILKTMHR